VEQLPSEEEIKAFAAKDEVLRTLLLEDNSIDKRHQYAQGLLMVGQTEVALMVLLAG